MVRLGTLATCFFGSAAASLLFLCGADWFSPPESSRSRTKLYDVPTFGRVVAENWELRGELWAARRREADLLARLAVAELTGQPPAGAGDGERIPAQNLPTVPRERERKVD